MAENTDWIDIAEKDGGIVVFPDSKDGKWTDGDIEFLRQLYSTCTSGTYAVEGASRYIVGTGAGGTLAAKWLVQDTNKFSALALIDAETVDLTGINKLNIPLPVLMISKEGNFDSGLTEYFKEANKVTDTDRKKNDVKYYRNDSQPWNNDFSKTNYVRQITTSKNTEQLSQFIWDELFNTVRRWLTILNEGTLREKKLASDMGMRRIEEHDIINNVDREALVYIPTAVKSGKIAGPIPIVMLFHGVTATGEYHADQAEWYKAAEKNNFILYVPTGVGNRWNAGIASNGTMNDIGYFGTRIDDFAVNGIKVGDSTYKVDGSRIYVTGFSNGSFMTNAMAAAYPEKIAAIAGFSGPLDPKTVDPAKAKALPVWLILGNKDPYINAVKWDTQMLALGAYWRGLAGCQSDEVPEVKYHTAFGIKNNIKTEVYKSGSVEFRYSIEDNIVHGMVNEFPEIIWDEFFSRYQKSGNISIEIGK
jgi:poly(3-hydroxybutyrate) depolymerase